MSLSDPTLTHLYQPNDRPTVAASRPKISWWNKWFSIPPEWSEWEYSGLFVGSRARAEYPVYKRTNLLTGVREYELRDRGGDRWVIDPNVVEKENKYIVVGLKY